MINSSLPQLRMPHLAMILGEDRVIVTKSLNIETENNKDINIDEILEEEEECS